MDFVIELDNEGRIWVADSDGTTREEAWLPGADDTPLPLRASGLCPLEEKYIVGRWTSTTFQYLRQLRKADGGLRSMNTA
jgi:hypothetical protein